MIMHNQESKREMRNWSLERLHVVRDMTRVLSKILHAHASQNFITQKMGDVLPFLMWATLCQLIQEPGRRGETWTETTAGP